MTKKDDGQPVPPARATRRGSAGSSPPARLCTTRIVETSSRETEPGGYPASFVALADRARLGHQTWPLSPCKPYTGRCPTAACGAKAQPGPWPEWKPDRPPHQAGQSGQRQGLVVGRSRRTPASSSSVPVSRRVAARKAALLRPQTNLPFPMEAKSSNRVNQSASGVHPGQGPPPVTEKRRKGLSMLASFTIL